MQLRSLFPMEEHEKGWRKFETEVLEVRAIAFVGVQSLVTSINMMFGADYYNCAQEYIDSADSRDELAANFIKYAGPLSIALYILRLLVFVLSLKYRPWTRTIFYVQFLIQLSQAFMSIDVPTTQFYITSKMQACQIEFALTYFSFWPSFVCNVIAIFSFHISHYTFHDQSSTRLAGLCVFNLLVHVVTLFIIHLLITKLGLKFVEKLVRSEDTLTSKFLDQH